MSSLVFIHLCPIFSSDFVSGVDPNKTPNEQIYKEVYTDTADWAKHETLTFWRNEMARIAPMFPHNSKSAQSDTQSLIKDVNKLVSSTSVYIPIKNNLS